jgi:hypothetical protein
MISKLTGRPTILFSGFLLVAVILSFSGPGNAGDPRSASYNPEGYTKLLWFIQASDTHIGASGSKDSNNLTWLVTQASTNINPRFILVTGDLTDSTNGNFLGIPNGPYQAEWTQYKSILSAAGITSTNDGRFFYYDIPGNHDAYNDGDFSYYLENSIQGKATGTTQVSFVKSLPTGEAYHFLGLNTAGTGLSFSLTRPWGDDAGLNSQELAFIHDQMELNKGSNLTIVFGHHPLFDTGDSDDTWVGPGLGEFLGYMNDYMGVLYGYGHTHISKEAFFVPTPPAYPGFYYFNVAALGKDTPNQYGITAIDNNGISSKAFTVGAWPAVLITAPPDAQFGTANPYAYSVTNSASNFVRALVFDIPTASPTVRYRIDSGTTWYNMDPTPSAHVYQANWNASSLAGGTHTIEVQAASASGTRSDTISVSITGPAPVLKAGATVATGKISSRIFAPTSTFSRGNTIVFRVTAKDSNGSPISGATVDLQVSGPTSKQMKSDATNALGQVDITWATSRKSTPVGTYTVEISGISSGYPWNGTQNAVPFKIQ